MSYAFVAASSQNLRCVSDGFTALAASYPCSVVAWFKPTDLPGTGDRRIATLHNASAADTSHNRVEIYDAAGAGAEFLRSACAGGGAANSGGAGGQTLNTTDWHLAVATFDGTGNSCTQIIQYTWRSGLSTSPVPNLDSGALTSKGVAGTTDNITIGASGTGSGGPFNGLIAEVSVWDAVLTASQVVELTTKFATNVTGFGTNCKAYWPLDTNGGLTDDVGSFVLTASGAAYDATHPTLSSGASAVAAIAGRHYSRMRA